MSTCLQAVLVLPLGPILVGSTDAPSVQNSMKCCGGKTVGPNSLDALSNAVQYVQ